jgi:hypothetical protein
VTNLKNDETSKGWIGLGGLPPNIGQHIDNEGVFYVPVDLWLALSTIHTKKSALVGFHS